MAMLKRWVDCIGAGGVARVAVESIWRIPQRPMPATQYAELAWASESMPKDLKGKTFAITGSSRGLGFILARNIAQRGGNLFLLNRSSAHTDQAREEIQKLAATAKSGPGTVKQINCDLCDFGSVRKAAEELRAGTEELDCLVLNAGLMGQLDERTVDGFDRQMQANHLSHFLLTSLVFDLVEKAAGARGEARVVSHSSGARGQPDAVLREDIFEKSWAKDSPCAGDEKAFAKWNRYQQSKRANLAYTYALADWIEKNRTGSKVIATCAHPGATNSGLQAHTDANTFLDRFGNGLAVVAGMSTEDGCLGLAMAALKDGAANGDFFGPHGITGPGELLASERQLGAGYDAKQLTMLWEKSCEATGAKWTR